VCKREKETETVCLREGDGERRYKKGKFIIDTFMQ